MWLTIIGTARATVSKKPGHNMMTRIVMASPHLINELFSGTLTLNMNNLRNKTAAAVNELRHSRICII
jgi:hypothetical protein